MLKEKKRCGEYEFLISICSDIKEIFEDYIEPYFFETFEIKGGYYKYKNRKAYDFYLNSKILFLFLHNICELPKGNKKGKLRVPTIIWNASSDVKANFLAGFFDSDGYITVNKKIGFGLNKEELEFLKELKILFKQLGVNTRKITKLGGKRFKGWEFSICWDSLLIFINKIPSKHPKKVKRLNNLKKVLIK